MIPQTPPSLTSFGYLFPDLQEDPEALLPRGRGTLEALNTLGENMVDVDPETEGSSEGSSSIPAAYTYFGQFVDHDIVMEARSNEIADITSPDLEPLLLQQVLFEIKNTRSAALDLDSVYGPPALRQGEQLRLGEVSQFQGPVPQDPFHDLFRQGRMPGEPEYDRQALIGDPRNDENLIVAQLHVAFLRAHKALVENEDLGMSFEQARRTLRQHYQWLVVHDFLPRIVDPRILSATLAGARFYDPFRKPFFLPLEFTAAAFRFGHSMVRKGYRYNEKFPKATLKDLFTFTALSGDFKPSPPEEDVPPGGFETLPDSWIIDWSGFIGPEAQNRARFIDTGLAKPFLRLPNMPGQVRRDEAGLAARNLRRGYLMRIPTGQAVARRMGLEPLTADEIRGITPFAQSDALAMAGLLDRTPLWFYVLAEAKHASGGQRLGPVGSTLVAEVLIGLVRRSEDSILSGSGGWRPTLGSEGRFELPDLLRLAGVLPPEQPAAPFPVA